MSTLNVTRNTTESLASLSEKRQQGYSVMRSAHIGNARTYNLALASEGIPMLLVDHTITGVDTNYAPEAIITRETRRTIAPLGQLAFRSMSEGIFLDQLHSRTLAGTFPDTPVICNADYLRRNESIAGDVVACTLDETPELFGRIVETDGELSRDIERAILMTKREGILQLKDDYRRECGVLMPNEVDILANFVIEALDSGRATQYHISGPDMIRYMYQPKSREDRRTPLMIINTLYDKLRTRASFRNQLPEQLNVELVTSTSLRFATTSLRRERLDTLLAATSEVTSELQQLNSKKRDFFKSPCSRDVSKRGKFLDETSNMSREILSNFAGICAQTPELFTDTSSPTFLTQYDLADDTLYVPEAVKESPMHALDELWKTVQAYRQGKPT